MILFLFIDHIIPCTAYLHALVAQMAFFIPCHVSDEYNFKYTFIDDKVIVIVKEANEKSFNSIDFDII